MHCPTCHHDNPEEARFCNQCGVVLKTEPRYTETRKGLSKRAWIVIGIAAFMLALGVITNKSKEQQLSPPSSTSLAVVETINKIQPETLQQSPQPSPAKSTTPVGKGINSAEKRKDLIMKCQQTLQSIPKIPLKRRKQMAALASEADASLKAAGGILGGAWAVNPTEAVKSMLDDAEFFIREIDRCSESTKKGKSCTLSTDAQGVLRDYTEQALSQFTPHVSHGSQRHRVNVRCPSREGQTSSISAGWPQCGQGHTADC
jgi:ribosomal protein L34E